MGMMLAFKVTNREFTETRRRYNNDAFHKVFFTASPSSMSSSFAFTREKWKNSNKHKHLSLILNSKLRFDEHVQRILNWTCKIIGLIRKLQPIKPRSDLLTICKIFLRYHLVNGDIIHDQAFNESFQKMLIFVWYYVALAITGIIKGSSWEKYYQELGFESLKSRRLSQKLCWFSKLKKRNEHPSYVFVITLNVLSTPVTRNDSKLCLK